MYSWKVDTWSKRFTKNIKRREPRIEKSSSKATEYEVIQNSLRMSAFEEPYSPDDRVNQIAMEHLQNRRNKIYYYLQSNPANVDYIPELGKEKLI